jgi:hypothetical protein
MSGYIWWHTFPNIMGRGKTIFHRITVWCGRFNNLISKKFQAQHRFWSPGVTLSCMAITGRSCHIIW